MLMKLLIFLAPVILVSCITREKCMNRYPPETSVMDSVYTKDSIHVVHDTVKTPGERVEVRIPIPCPDFYAEKEVKKNGTIARITIDRGVAECDCQADSLINVITQMSRIKETGRSTSKKETHHTTDWYIPWWIHFIYGTSLTIAFLLGRKSKTILGI